MIETKRRKSLPLDFPEVCKEWCSTHNTELNISDVVPSSGQRACFVCANGHHRTVRLSLITAGYGRCNICANRTLLKGFNDVGTLRPELIEEWDFDANGDVTPWDVLPQSPFRAQWICQEGHKYVVAVLRRFQQESSRCPVCTNKAALKCPACGGDIPQDWRARPKKTCSRTCHRKQYLEENPDYVKRQKELGKARSKRNYQPTSYEKTCATCRESFTAKRSDNIYCSTECLRRAYTRARHADGRRADDKAKRRALAAGAKVTPGRREDVHKASGYVCQLCGIPVVKTAQYPSALAPVVDHRVALARGGAHSPENWQTAHSYCNLRKRELSMREFTERYPFISLMMARRFEDLGVKIVSPSEFAGMLGL